MNKKDFNYKRELSRMYESMGGQYGLCEGICCTDCIFTEAGIDCCEPLNAPDMIELVREWAVENPKERKINWHEVPRGTDVIVWDGNYNLKVIKKFFHYDEYSDLPFIVYANSDIPSLFYGFTYCMFAPTVKIKEEWYED